MLKKTKRAIKPLYSLLNSTACQSMNKTNHLITISPFSHLAAPARRAKPACRETETSSRCKPCSGPRSTRHSHTSTCTPLCTGQSSPCPWWVIERGASECSHRAHRRAYQSTTSNKECAREGVLLRPNENTYERGCRIKGLTASAFEELHAALAN